MTKWIEYFQRQSYNCFNQNMSFLKLMNITERGLTVNQQHNPPTATKGTNPDQDEINCFILWLY